MSGDKGPVVVSLICEAQPSTETEEIDRAEWDAMTPTQRLMLLDDMATTHMTNAGGYGWTIEDPDDEAVVSDTLPDSCRGLAEWLVSLDGPWRQEESSSRISQAVARARRALGHTEEG